MACKSPKLGGAALTRSLAILIGSVGFACIFHLEVPAFDRRVDIRTFARQLQSQVSRGISPRELENNRDMAVGVRGPYGHNIEALDANHAVRSDRTTRRAAVMNEHQYQGQQMNNVGIVQNLRKSLRKMLGGEDTVINRNHRNLGEYNLTIVNNVTNETEVQCQFTATMGPDQIAEETDPSAFVNTIVVGYPGPDKRTVLRQMEAMTGLSGRDAWDFQFLGMTSQPFIKTNYPHHEGIWGWQDHADQVVLILRNPRRSIDEYHDILADIHYAKTWEEATDKIPDLFQGIVEADKYAMWRNERTMDEIGWYGWLIDYWMEDGLLRDYFDHKVTTPEHFELLREPETYTYGELQWDVNVCTDAVAEEPLPLSYDKLCATDVSMGCSPVAVLAAERLMDPERGHAENRKIGLFLNETDGIKDYLIDDVAWDCLYDEIIGNNPTGASPDQSRGEGDAGTGYHDFRYRSGADERKHPLSTRMLRKMVAQLTRLITKYSAYDPETGIDWPSYQTAIDLVDILNEYLVEIQEELDATPNAVFPHAPKPNWAIFPVCGPNIRSAWDFNYPGQDIVYGTADGLPLYG